MASVIKYLLVFFFILCSLAIVNGQVSHPDEDGYVPDKETAIKIAEAIWLPVFGEKIYKNKPFIAELKKGVWIVQGTLHAQKGGVPYIEIQKKDCKVLKITHGK